MGFFKRRAILVVLVLFFIAIQLFSLDLRERKSQNPASRFVLTLTYYPQKLISTVTDKVAGTWRDYIDLVHVNEENKRLREELNALRQQKFELAEIEAQNTRLKKLLDFKDVSPYPVVSANVIGASPSILRSQVVIVDKGRSDGITEGMPVASYDGIVGRILLAGDKSSEVLLITDPVSAVDAYIHRTRARGIVKGVGNGCVMEYIENKSDVSVGDKVISSGKDGFFPKGVIIGTVTDISPSGSFISAGISPHVDLNSLEEVVVIQKSVNNVVMNE
ncbi:MAG TPA: rod shape-determining protein MreC [Thermodesulfobacteriota bacterium]|jgi:rod shape-determining protein MreC|nr:rod shape-determining protein MreC [Thermodesulfobacteriota bacterium]